MKLGNGFIYNGEVNDKNKPEGKGTITHIDDDDAGIKIVGTFTADGGTGVFTDAQGSNIEIVVDFKGPQGGLTVVSGRGKHVTVDEDGIETRVGTFDVATNTFVGTNTLPNGAVVEGTINMITGHPVSGTRTHKNGKQGFTGTFNKAGRPLTGTRTFEDGTTFTGTFKKGKPFDGTYTNAAGTDIATVKNGATPITTGALTTGALTLLVSAPEEEEETVRDVETSSMIEESVLEMKQNNSKYYKVNVTSIYIDNIKKVSEIDPITLRIVAFGTDLRNSTTNSSDIRISAEGKSQMAADDAKAAAAASSGGDGAGSGGGGSGS